ncbi:MAG: helix-turn-helix domain-containing protein [Bradyrhizobium sp.]|nr:helix-turn-helix domain-containing protein [Bradyrhizobium sp.]
MHELITPQLPACDDDLANERQLQLDEDLAAFTRALGTNVDLNHWEREESCNALLAEDGIGWVLVGILRKHIILESGRRRIVDLMMPGNFFGLKPDDASRFSYEAATDGTVTARSSWRRLKAFAASNAQIYQFLYDRACDSIGRLEEHIVVQGRTTATEKVGSYLVRIAARGGSERTSVVLPISRHDIADHLGIAVETVSRAISELQRSGLIRLEGRRLVIKDPHRLESATRPERQNLRECGRYCGAV